MLNICTRSQRVPIYADGGRFHIVVSRLSTEKREGLTALLTELQAAAARAEKAGTEISEDLTDRARAELDGMIEAVEGLSVDDVPVETFEALSSAASAGDPVGWPALFWTLWTAAVEVQFVGSPLARASASTPGSGSGSQSSPPERSTAPGAPNPDGATKQEPTPATG